MVSLHSSCYLYLNNFIPAKKLLLCDTGEGARKRSVLRLQKVLIPPIVHFLSPSTLCSLHLYQLYPSIFTTTYSWNPGYIPGSMTSSLPFKLRSHHVQRSSTASGSRSNHPQFLTPKFKTLRILSLYSATPFRFSAPRRPNWDCLYSTNLLRHLQLPGFSIPCAMAAFLP